MNDKQIEKVKAIAATADANYDHDVVALGYVDGIREALAVPRNNSGTALALAHLATHLGEKDSAKNFVDEIDSLIHELA